MTGVMGFRGLSATRPRLLATMVSRTFSRGEGGQFRYLDTIFFKASGDVIYLVNVHRTCHKQVSAHLRARMCLNVAKTWENKLSVNSRLTK